jgi:hypothetical protein
MSTDRQHERNRKEITNQNRDEMLEKFGKVFFEQHS